MAPLTYTCLDIIKDAFIEIGACPPGENPSPDEQQWGFRKFNDLLDLFQAKQAYVWGYAFQVFNLPANTNPISMGPGATFDTGNAPRPARIESAAWLINNSSSTGLVDLPINIRDRAWWAANQVKQITTNVPTDLFPDYTYPNASLYFWPVSNVNGQVRLQWWQTVSQFTAITDAIGGPGGPGTLPQAYRTALKLTLAEMLCPGANREPSPTLVEGARQARVAVFGNNAKSPRIQTADSGMPKAGSRPGTRQDWNWAIGNYPGGRPQ